MYLTLESLGKPFFTEENYDREDAKKYNVILEAAVTPLTIQEEYHQIFNFFHYADHQLVYRNDINQEFAQNLKLPENIITGIKVGRKAIQYFY